jgi:hypothetical protein
VDSTVNLPGEPRSGPDPEGAAHCLFAEPWWLDAVAPGDWGDVLQHEGDELRARLPFTLKRRFGVTALTQPALTPLLGPWLSPSEAGKVKALAREHSLMEELIAALPPHDLFRQAFHPAVSNWLPFYWEGFSSSVMYTYRLEQLEDLDAVWSGLRQNIRREIRKAERQLEVTSELPLDTFLEVNAKTFARQGLPPPYPAELVARVDRACADRDARRVLFAQDAQGRLHAALYVVWDQHSAYYLMSGADPDLRTSGAQSLLAWEAIRHAGALGRSFDFEGSMIKPIERFFRSFGATQVPYLHVSREGRRGRLASGLQDALVAARTRASTFREEKGPA